MSEHEEQDAEQTPLEEETPETPASAPAPAPTPGRAEQLGLPADNDEEVHVETVRPKLVLAHPFGAIGLLVLPIVVAILLLTLTEASIKNTATWGTLTVLALVTWFALMVWWVRVRWTCSLYITNKRTIERRGLLSRSSDEVLHDHVRNINVDQSFFERVLNVGSVGISSAGQSGTEIQVDKIPNPDRIKEIIDAYRDDLGSHRGRRDGE